MLFGIPSALLSSAFGAISGFIFKLISQRNEIVASERKHQVDMIGKVATANTATAEAEIALLKAKANYETKLAETDPHRSIARRVIAYGLTIGLVFFIPVIYFYDPINIQWFMFHEWTTSGFFGLGRKEVVDVVVANGIPLVWLTSLLDVFAAVISFYFGGSLAKFKNPYAERK